jgi:hypothetical protein
VKTVISGRNLTVGPGHRGNLERRRPAMPSVRRILVSAHELLLHFSVFSWKGFASGLECEGLSGSIGLVVDEGMNRCEDGRGAERAAAVESVSTTE